MRLLLVSWAIPFAIAAALAATDPTAIKAEGVASPSARPVPRGVAHFEPPRSIGTPIGDIARSYSGVGLADRIAGRFRLDTDSSLTEAARQLVRRRLALGS